jgi:hypothetical protein
MGMGYLLLVIGEESDVLAKAPYSTSVPSLKSVVPLRIQEWADRGGPTLP